MKESPTGQDTIMFLLARGRLETIVSTGSATRELMLRKARVRLTGARAARDAGDFEGAFVASYDSYRISAEAILAEQGLRAVSGKGSHTTVEDAIAVQFAAEIQAYSKPTFERSRRTRNSVQYFDPSSPEIDFEDAEWAIETAEQAGESTAQLLGSGIVAVFNRP